jgi:hypothetical protein
MEFDASPDDSSDQVGIRARKGITTQPPLGQGAIEQPGAGMGPERFTNAQQILLY